MQLLHASRQNQTENPHFPADFATSQFSFLFSVSTQNHLYQPSVIGGVAETEEKIENSRRKHFEPMAMGHNQQSVLLLLFLDGSDTLWCLCGRPVVDRNEEATVNERNGSHATWNRRTAQFTWSVAAGSWRWNEWKRLYFRIPIVSVSETDDNGGECSMSANEDLNVLIALLLWLLLLPLSQYGAVYETGVHGVSNKLMQVSRFTNCNWSVPLYLL